MMDSFQWGNTMRTTYKNPWYDPKNPYSKPEFESESEPVSCNGCFIYRREEFGEPIFDVVLDGMCVAQRYGLNGAKKAVETESWKEREWWKKLNEVSITLEQFCEPCC